MTQKQARGDKKKADDLFSKQIRARDPICRRCQSARGAECAHIIRRIYTATRYEWDNCLGLCAKCHWAVDNDALAMKDLVAETIGEVRWRELRQIAQDGVGAKYDFAAILERLRAAETV